MLFVPTYIQIFLNAAHLYGSISSMRIVDTLHEFNNVLLVSGTRLVLLSSSTTHVLGLGGGVLVDN